MYTRIESAKNEHIKNIKKLYLKKYRDEQGLYIAEGKKLFLEAVASGAHIETVVISELLFEAEADILLKGNSAKTYIVPKIVFDSLCELNSPEGIMAVLRKPQMQIDTAVKDTKIALLLDEIKDPGNLGTILRSADAFGAEAVIVSKNCVDVWSPKVIRASMGSCFHVRIAMSENIIEDIGIIKSFGFTLIAGDLKGQPNVGELNKALIAVGSESHGISAEVLKEADVLYRIPMRGSAESLNASVAASIMLYDICNKVHTCIDQRI